MYMDKITEEIFQKVYSESRQKLMEVSVTTFTGLLKNALYKGIKAGAAGHDFGKKFARRPYENSLQPISNIIDNVTIETFRKNNPEINTKLIETVYVDTLLNFKDNLKAVKDYFEAFIEELKTAGVPFVPSSKLKIF